MTTARTARGSEDRHRFGRLVERDDGRDFPFYDGEPVEVASWRWVVVVLSCVAGFVCLTMLPVSGEGGLLLARCSFVAVPAAVFVALTGGFWRSIFRPVHGRDLVAMVGFWLLNLAVSIVVAYAASGGDIGHFTKNSATDGLADAGAGALALFYLGTFIQLFGEELFTVLPFLAVLYWCHAKARLGRRTSVVLAWLVTAVWFGAAHLQTYGWDVVQALVVIGSARLVLTLAFVRTKNILVSFGAHLLNDWVTFTFAIIASVGMLAGS